MAKTSKKEVLKWIEEQVKVLEPETYVAFPKEFGVPPHKQFETKKVEPYWYEVPTEYPVNHKRRVWRMYKRFGLAGINHYFLLRGYSLGGVTLPGI